VRGIDAVEVVFASRATDIDAGLANAFEDHLGRSGCAFLGCEFGRTFERLGKLIVGAYAATHAENEYEQQRLP
jgi:hypothetical protein